MPPLRTSERNRLPDSAFAYIDSAGARRLPIHDASHVRNALARFDQTPFDDDAARERARQRLVRAARKHGIVPIGFFDKQLQKERAWGELKAKGADVARLPRGTVTLLFTDVEGSTRLLRRLGAEYTPLLREIRTLIRASVRAAGGHEVDCRGDEFFAVFTQAAGALQAAIAIQGALRERSRREQCKVRIGIHTGRAALNETGYVGLAVHAASRICSAAKGGQIVVSAAAREAIDGTLAQDVRFRSLGPHLLAGLPRQQVLFEAREARSRAR